MLPFNHALHPCLQPVQEETARCEPLRQQVQALEKQLAAGREELAGAHRQVQTLSDTVDAANDAIVVGAAAARWEGLGCCQLRGAALLLLLTCAVAAAKIASGVVAKVL